MGKAIPKARKGQRDCRGLHPARSLFPWETWRGFCARAGAFPPTDRRTHSGL